MFIFRPDVNSKFRFWNDNRRSYRRESAIFGGFFAVVILPGAQCFFFPKEVAQIEKASNKFQNSWKLRKETHSFHFESSQYTIFCIIITISLIKLWLASSVKYTITYISSQVDPIPYFKLERTNETQVSTHRNMPVFYYHDCSSFDKNISS